MKRSRLAVLLIALAAGPASALGQGDVARVERHLEEGREHFDAGRYAEALALLEAVEPEVEAGGGIVGFPWAKARCLEKLGRLDEALVAYRRFLELATEPDDRARGEARVRALQARIAEQERPWTFGVIVHGGLALLPTGHPSIEPGPGLVLGLSGLVERDWQPSGFPWPLGVRLEGGWQGTFVSFTDGERDGRWQWHATSFTMAGTLRPAPALKLAVGAGPALMLSMAETVDGAQLELGHEFEVIRWDVFADAAYRVGDVLLGLRPGIALMPRRKGDRALRVFTLVGQVGLLFGG